MNPIEELRMLVPDGKERTLELIDQLEEENERLREQLALANLQVADMIDAIKEGS